MKQTNKTTPKRPSGPAVSPLPVQKPASERLELWLAARRRRVLGLLVLGWVLLRVAMFHTIADGPLYEMYRWPESDNCFFDEWARKLANGDWLSREAIHPFHGWHREFADYYFKQHPEKLREIQAANPGRDSTFVPGKVLWNEWYGGNIYHQEPLYPYVLAVLYTFGDHAVYWMLVLQALLGVCSGILLWRIARRYFGETAALVTGILYLFCGIVLFQEALLLRSSWIVFFVLATISVFDYALEKRTPAGFFPSGLCTGLAFLLQSTFILFLMGALAMFGYRERRRPVLAIKNSALMTAGFFVMYGLVMMRNAAVGAPLMSISSVGAVTFVASNVHDTKTVETWMPEAAKCAEIMGKTGGKFGAAAMAAIRTHPSPGAYLQLMWSKCRQTLNGTEWPNNENYYFYRQQAPALQVAFLNFYWFGWLGIAGLLFSIYYRKRCGTLYLSTAIQVALLTGFYVLGRFRCPLAVLLLPFSAYALVTCFTFPKGSLKASLQKLGFVALCFLVLSFPFYRPGYRGLDPVDYMEFYELNYYVRVKSNAESGKYPAAIAAHDEFLACQPDWVRNARPGQLFSNPMDINILYLFADHYQIHAYLFEDSGNKHKAAVWMAKYEGLKRIADGARVKR